MWANFSPSLGQQSAASRCMCMELGLGGPYSACGAPRGLAWSWNGEKKGVDLITSESENWTKERKVDSQVPGGTFKGDRHSKSLICTYLSVPGRNRIGQSCVNIEKKLPFKKGRGGFGWGGVEGWGENTDNCNWTTIKKKIINFGK